MNIQPADLLVHFSNILLLISYSVRNILWLRWFAVAAALTNIPYFLIQGTILWPPVIWAMVFTAINLFQIARIYLERRPVILAPDEQMLYDLSFKTLRPREFVSLLLAGQWKDAAPGEQLLAEGERVSSVCIPIKGSVDVLRRGERLGRFRPGDLVGTALALTGEPSSVEARVSEAARYMCWPLASLRTFLEKRPELRVTIQALVNRDLARKLERVVAP
ncbi:MAG TPA: cyclic nucleotide-binding domain-containing protein [Steroidobacteraceae bacterium]|nr:cyclic nucleotide-binding domain-containing protein [Steroidobacteraceae bacterium]